MQFCERCFEQGDRKSQQNELEFVLELDSDFFGRKKKSMGARISRGGPLGAHETGGVPWNLVARCWLPLVCSQCQIFPNIPEKIIFKFQGIWRTFIFGVFLYCKDNSDNRQKILILLYLILITESKKWVQKVLLSNFIHLMLIKRNPLTRWIKSY